MMSKEVFDYFEEDARLVQEEAQRQIDEQKAFIAAQDALTELDEYLSTMSLKEQETALEGLKEYAKAVLHENDIEHGWHRLIDTID